MFNTNLISYQSPISNAPELPVDISATVAPWLDRESLGRYACCSKAIHAIASLSELWNKFKPDYLNWLIVKNPFPKRISLSNLNGGSICLKLHDKWLIRSSAESIRIFDRQTLAQLANVPLRRMHIIAAENGRLLCRNYSNLDLRVVNLANYEFNLLDNAVSDHFPPRPILLADGSVLSHPDLKQINFYDPAGQISYQCDTQSEVTKMGYWNNSIITAEGHTIMRYPLSELTAPIEVVSRPHQIHSMVIFNDTVIALTDEPLIVITDLKTLSCDFINVALPELRDSQITFNSTSLFLIRNFRNSTRVLYFDFCTTKMHSLNLSTRSNANEIDVFSDGRALLVENREIFRLPQGGRTSRNPLASSHIPRKFLGFAEILPDPEQCRVFVIEDNGVSALDYSLPKWYAKKTTAVVDRLWVKPVMTLNAIQNYSIKRASPMLWQIEGFVHDLSSRIRLNIDYALAFRRKEIIVVACGISILLVNKLYRE